MAISPGQAAAALQDIEQTERRTRVSGGYSRASPYLILWGAIWAAGYVGCALVPPDRWGLVWLPLVVVGSALSAWLGSRTPRRGAGTEGVAKTGGQSFLMALAIGAFFGSIYVIFPHAEPRAYLVFPVMTMGLIYCLAGILARLPRFAWIGAGAFAITLAGTIMAPALTAWWAAAAGGGGLILGGLWLRKV
jgi:hypothetical protein